MMIAKAMPKPEPMSEMDDADECDKATEIVSSYLRIAKMRDNPSAVDDAIKYLKEYKATLTADQQDPQDPMETEEDSVTVSDEKPADDMSHLFNDRGSTYRA